MREVTGWRELVPTAFLLAGSDAGARDLLARGLARGGGVDGLVRAHLRRRVGRDGVLSGTSGTPWWVSPADAAAAAELAAGLDTLTRAERAAVVLRWFEDRPAAEVGARVPGVDLAALPGRLGVPADRLPARLELLAGTVQTTGLDDAAVAHGVRTVRTRRVTRPLLAVGAVALLGLGAVVLPDLVPRGSTPTATATTAPDLPAGPARGSLAGDADFVAGLRTQLAPAPDQPRLLFAGDAVGARWALFVRVGDDTATGTWFTGAAGSAPAEMSSVQVGYSGDPPAVWSATVEDGQGAAVLVVASPGDEVSVSPGFDVAPDGTASRTFQPVATTDGVSAVQLDRDGGGVVAQISRDGVPVSADEAVSLAGGNWTAGPPPPARSGTAPVDALAFETALYEISRPTGRPVADLQVGVLGSGTFPAPGGATARVVTVAAVLPGGAVVTSTAAETSDGQVDTCGTRTHPAGTDLATLTVVSRCASYAADSSTFGATLVVAAPPGAAVVLNTDAGGTPTSPGLDGGWGYQVDGADDLTVFSADGVAGEVARGGDGPFDTP